MNCKIKIFGKKSVILGKMIPRLQYYSQSHEIYLSNVFLKAN